MSFLDRVVGAANELLKKGEGQPGLAEGLVGLLKEKGVSGIVADFKNKGLGEIASSWVGGGPNSMISAEQIKAALGSERVLELARRAGVSETVAVSFLRDTLPGLIDRLTPEGKTPPDDPGAGAGPTSNAS
ncbi:MAG: YidB family protein [Leptospirales bacterium]|nr:YidB family protein [Leptospirales bacterium]